MQHVLFWEHNITEKVNNGVYARVTPAKIHRRLCVFNSTRTFFYFYDQCTNANYVIVSAYEKKEEKEKRIKKTPKTLK